MVYLQVYDKTQKEVQIMPCWEYDIKSIRTDQVDKTKEDLNQMGLDGWELVKFVGQADENGMVTSVFKRVLDEANI